jgi:hypothetical protein
MEVLRWLRNQNDLATTIGFYCELSRKFMTEGKCRSTLHLLEDHLEANLRPEDHELLTEL